MTPSGEFTWGSAIKLKSGIITTIKVDQDIKERQKYDVVIVKSLRGKMLLVY